MASIKYSAFGGELKGKVGSTAFQGGKAGPSVRSIIHRSFVRLLALVYGMPQTTILFGPDIPITWETQRCFMYTNGQHNGMPLRYPPNTHARTIAAGWQNLTSARRDAWNASAVNRPFKNRFGDLYTGSGFQCYSQSMQNLMSVNADPQFDQLPLPDSAFIEWCLIEFAQDLACKFQISFGDVAPNNYIKVFSGPGQSPGKGGFKGKKLIAIINPALGGESWDLTYIWQIFFGKVQPNTVINFEAVAVNKFSGLASQPCNTNIKIGPNASAAVIQSDSAVIPMGFCPVDHETLRPVNVVGFNVPGECVFDFTGANANLFRLDIDSDEDFQESRTKASNQWDNLYPSVVGVRVTPAAPGAFTANLRVRNIASGASLLIPITGTGTP